MNKSTSPRCTPIVNGTARPERRLASAGVLGLLVTALLIATPAAAEVKKFKTVNEDGQVIYGPTPPDDPNQPYCEREGDGPWTCFEKAESLIPPPPPEDVMTAEQRQRREDQLLMSRYRTLDGIEQAEDERLRQLEFEQRTVERNHQSQQNTLFDHIRSAADRQRAGLEVTERQREQIQATRQTLGVTERTLERLERQADEIRSEHDALRDRFRELMTTP